MTNQNSKLNTVFKHTRKIVFIILLIINTSVLTADDRPKIDSILNQAIIIKDGWAGQSIVLIKEMDRYFIIRRYFGSGVPVVATIKYEANITSDYQVRFSKIVETKGADMKENIQEEFILTIIEKNKIKLLLNGIQVVADFKLLN